MDDYTVTFARSARKELERLDSGLVSRIFPKIESLARQPHPKGSRKLQGEKNLWRIRIGDYRIIYTISSEKRMVDIIAIRHRSDAYRKR